MIARLHSAEPGFAGQLAALLAHQPSNDEQVRATVQAVIAAVRAQGDEAVLRYAQEFDSEQAADVASLEVSRGDCEAALDSLPQGQRAALKQAADRIRNYALRQGIEAFSFEDEFGNRFAQRVTPLDRVGIYVPGGKASYPSSVLMNAIPARLAGVGEILMTAPAPAGELNALVLAAAAVSEVDRVFRVGGAQAIAALAYGTKSIPAVDKIVGPGNAWVAAAKREVFGQVGIDMVAGPSEIVIVSDGSVDPAWLALDMCAQAEHDESAQSLLLSTDADHLAAVQIALAAELQRQPRAEVIAASLAARGALIQVTTLEQACDIVNEIAPEHLELAVQEPDALLSGIRHAGAIFLGASSAEAFGDYCAGPNHVLPTARAARYASPLGVYDFQKRSSVLDLSAAGAAALAPIVDELARGEGLAAHAGSARVRGDQALD